MSEEKWSGYVKLTDKGVDWFKDYAIAMRKSLDYPKFNPKCYSCNKKIKEEVRFIEYIPLFMRYVCFCNECHEKYDKGEYVEVIKVYEEYLAGKASQLDYMRIYYKYHPNKFDGFLEKFSEVNKEVIRNWFK